MVSQAVHRNTALEDALRRARRLPRPSGTDADQTDLWGYQARLRAQREAEAMRLSRSGAVLKGRRCAANGCKRLMRRKDYESASTFRRRKTCNALCSARLKRQRKAWGDHGS